MIDTLLVLLFVVLGALLAALLAELATRLWLARRGSYYVWTPGSHLAMELERASLPTLPPVVRFDANREGERGPELPDDRAGTYRVLVAGGSAAECYYLDQETTWPEVIRRELSRPEALAQLGAEHVHVGNVGRSLVACEHVRVLLERTLPRYDKLDCLVFMVGASDMVFWLERGTPPTLDDEPLPTERLFASHPEGPFGWRPKALAARRVAAYWRHVLRHEVTHRTRTGKTMIELRKMRAAAETWIEEVPDPAPMLDHFERHYRELLRFAGRYAKRVVVARQPWFEKEFTPDEAQWMWQFGAGRPYLETVTTYYRHAVVWKLMRRIDERAAAIADELGVDHVDLQALLPRDLDHYYDEMHHTPKGCAVIGRAVARTILGADVAATPAPASGSPSPSPGARGTRTGSR